MGDESVDDERDRARSEHARASLTDASVSDAQARVRLVRARASLTDASVSDARARVSLARARASLTDASVSDARVRVRLARARASQTDAFASDARARVSLARARASQEDARAVRTGVRVGQRDGALGPVGRPVAAAGASFAPLVAPVPKSGCSCVFDVSRTQDTSVKARRRSESCLARGPSGPRRALPSSSSTRAGDRGTAGAPARPASSAPRCSP